MTWRVADSLETLRFQLNDLFPRRSKASDGGIGDARHQSTGSDHNPHIVGKGGIRVVSARDFTHDPKTGIDCQWLADMLVKNRDPRIKYIIWNKQICSSKTSPWKWRAYSGKNAHKHHLHLSVMADAKLYDSKTPWKLDFSKAKISATASTTKTEATDNPSGLTNTASNTAGSSADPLPTDIVPIEQTQPAVTNTVVEQKTTEATVGGETVTTTTAQSVAAPVEVAKESPSWMVKIAAPFTALAGLGINAGSFIQTKLEEMTVQQIGYMVAALGLVVLAIYWWQKAAKAAQARTMQLVEKASDKDATTVILVNKVQPAPVVVPDVNGNLEV